MATLITETITELSTPPTRQDPATFDTRADTFLSELPVLATELNTVITQANALSTAVNSESATASSSAAIALAAANYNGEWDDLTGAANIPFSCYHSVKYWMLNSNLADVTAKEPGVDSEWVEIVMGGTTLTKATGAEVNTGTDDAKYVTPKAMEDSSYIKDVVQDTTPQLGGDLDKQGYSTNWSFVPAANYTTGPASTSTLTMGADMTSSISVGQGLKYTIGGTVYYGMVSAIASNLLTVNGAPLSGNVSNLYYGGTVRQVVIIIPATYEDASNTALITSDLKSSLIWCLPKSYLVYYKVYSNTHDTGTHGQASVRINNTEVNTTAGGLTIAADATWYSTVVDIAIAAYDVNLGEAIEITAVKNGNGDASDLTVEMIFVTP